MIMDQDGKQIKDQLLIEQTNNLLRYSNDYRYIQSGIAIGHE